MQKVRHSRQLGGTLNLTCHISQEDTGKLIIVLCNCAIFMLFSVYMCGGCTICGAIAGH